MALIECKNLRVSYDNKTIIKDLSFDVNQGDYLCIIGENGAGKSTLIKSLLHLKKISGGKIVYGEKLVPTQIGYLPQQTEFQKDFPASVYEIVLSGCLNGSAFRPFYSKAQKELAQKNIELVGIKKLTKRSFAELSGGQQQRVLLARALCATSKLLLLDEPTAGLDANFTAEMYDLIKKLNDSGITIIMVSHDIPAVVKYAKQILQIDKANPFFGTTSEYLDSPAHIKYSITDLGGKD